MRAALATGLILALLAAASRASSPRHRSHRRSRQASRHPPQSGSRSRTGTPSQAGTKPVEVHVKAPVGTSGSVADKGKEAGALAGRILHDLARPPVNLKLAVMVERVAPYPAVLALERDGAFDRELTPQELAVLERAVSLDSRETEPRMSRGYALRLLHLQRAEG